jgi:RNA polymerase sigma-70 factor, ECF subfamily
VTNPVDAVVSWGVHYVSDSDLIARVLGGEVDAYGPLVRRYQDAYFRFALRMLGSRDDADDALQSAFVRAYRKLAECRDPARFGAWLYQIVINECRTLAFRRDRRERRMVRDDSELDRAVDIEAFDTRLGVEEIQRALNDLPAEQREAFVLKYVEELGYGEMSDLTGAGVSALKMRVKRACESLRELLGQSRSLHDG